MRSCAIEQSLDLTYSAILCRSSRASRLRKMWMYAGQSSCESSRTCKVACASIWKRTTTRFSSCMTRPKAIRSGQKRPYRQTFRKRVQLHV